MVTGGGTEIHAAKSCTAWVLTTEVASGGMCAAPKLLTRKYITEFVSDPNFTTRLFVLPKFCTNAPSTMPAEGSGVVMRASHCACCRATPPGWWHWTQLAAR